MAPILNLDPTFSMILQLGMALTILYVAKLSMDRKPIGQNLTTLLCIVGIIQIICPLMDLSKKVSNEIQ